VEKQGHSEGTLRPGARNILAPPSRKTTEFEMKNRCKSAEKAKQNIYSSSFFMVKCV